MSHRIWENLPNKFKLGEDPEQLVTVWRGDKIGRAATGMACWLGLVDAEDMVYKSLREYPKLHTLMKRHSNFTRGTPLVSLTRDIKVAQSFALNTDETIYEIILPVSKLLMYPMHPKYPDSVGPEAELFAVGKIEPADIVAVKINNDCEVSSEWDRSMSWVA